LQSPFVRVSCSEDAVRALCSRSVSIKSAYEVWGSASNWDALEESLRAFPAERSEAFLQGQTFKVRVAAAIVSAVR
jgi:hypothetical protein